MPTPTLTAWLARFPGIDQIEPVTVTIGTRDVYHTAARYRQALEYTAGMMCVSDGRHRAGETYHRIAIMCLGRRPKHRRARTCYRVGNQDWYVGCYYPKDDKNHYHPFGACFTLFPWDVADGSKIDDYEPARYDRLPLLVSPREEPS